MELSPRVSDISEQYYVCFYYTCRVCRSHKLVEQTIVRSLCDELLAKHIVSPHLFSTLVDMYGEESAAGNKESLDKAVEVS